MANTYNVCNKLQAIADAISQGGGGGGGTTVIANPSGTPTADLDTIQIGNTIYDIPGSGGGGGTGYTETTLWSGSPTTGSITLSDSVFNYDAIYCEAMFNNEAIIAKTIDKATFTSYLGSEYISLGAHGSVYYGITPASDATNFVFFGANYNGCVRVIGLKYARGGGSDQAVDINYDNTTSGLTADNVQDAIDENADNISALNSNIAQSGTLEFIKDIPSTATTWTDTGKYKALVVRAVISGYTVEARTSILSVSSDYVLPISFYMDSSHYMFINATVKPNSTSYTVGGYAGFSLTNIKLYGVL